MQARIAALHYCLPPKRLTNADLEERFDPKKLRSITKMSGIEERRVVEPGVTAVDLATQAARALLDGYQVKREEIDLLIFTSQTGDYRIPASACLLHQRLGLAETCAAFDIGMGCSGYPYSLSVASSMIHAGTANKALLLNADALTGVIHPGDRALVPLHGDGAAATLLEAAEENGIEGVELGTDGQGVENLIIPAGGARQPSGPDTCKEEEDEAGCIRTAENLRMNGPAVFHFSIYKVPEVIKGALEKWSLTMDDIDLVVLHQANKTMMDQIYRSLEVPPEKRFYFIDKIGNLSGASTPVTLAEAWRQGAIKPGSRTLIASFGVGLSWGVASLRWPEKLPAPVDAPIDYDPGFAQPEDHAGTEE